MNREIEQLSFDIIGAAIEVHKNLGPGLLERVYQECLVYELKAAGFKVDMEKCLPVVYKELKFSSAYRVDLLVNDAVILELKAVEELSPIYKSQLLSYLRLSGLKLGLLINFNVPILKNGIKRIVNNL